ncbi:MAG: hypothetical protein EOM14_15955, partial [Clostridia bacterium]|nr:hypothetical protein [Clostridia bacterium]
MKTIQKLFSCVFIFCLLTGSAFAETANEQAALETADEWTESEMTIEQVDLAATAETEDGIVPPTVEEQADAMGSENVKDALPQEANEILGDVSLTDLDMGDEGLKAIFDALKESVLGIFKNALSSAAKILTIVVLCSAATSSMSEGGIRDVVALSGTIAVSAIAVSNVHSFLGMGMETLLTLSDYSKALLPVLCSAAASAGAITSASAKYAATALFMDVLITIAVNVILPLISIYLAAVIANAVLSKDSLANVSKLLKWVCTTAMTLLMLAFTSYLGMTGLITGKADEFATKLTSSALG